MNRLLTSFVFAGITELERCQWITTNSLHHIHHSLHDRFVDITILNTRETQSYLDGLDNKRFGVIVNNNTPQDQKNSNEEDNDDRVLRPKAN